MFSSFFLGLLCSYLFHKSITQTRMKKFVPAQATSDCIEDWAHVTLLSFSLFHNFSDFLPFLFFHLYFIHASFCKNIAANLTRELKHPGAEVSFRCNMRTMGRRKKGQMVRWMAKMVGAGKFKGESHTRVSCMNNLLVALKCEASLFYREVRLMASTFIQAVRKYVVNIYRLRSE